ncbi:hypothetical protein BHJ80_12200 [Escherichia coli]|nr:hypothetical protein BHJ80_12200 [Escherichia coli]
MMMIIFLLKETVFLWSVYMNRIYRVIWNCTLKIAPVGN